MTIEPKLVRFKQNVLSKFEIYNSIFMTLPFDSVTKTGVLLPLFHETCKKGYDKGDDPTAIVNTFFKKPSNYFLQKSNLFSIGLLFK